MTSRWLAGWTRLGGGCAAALVLACGSSEPAEGLRERLERERREELTAEVERRVKLEKAKLQAELEETQRRSGLKVTLPKGEAAEIDPSLMSLVIAVPASGDVVVSGRAVPDDELDTLFRAAFARDKGTQVVLQADKGVPHGKVVGIMEKAKAAGLTRLAIGTSP
ncbi:MAG TPA: biopolymer transporter ExbD [Kofleriaceae bacterium]|nr:biopolymer transporter ExbD [Kofleriaceae bacterium]